MNDTQRGSQLYGDGEQCEAGAVSEREGADLSAVVVSAAESLCLTA